MYSAAACFCAGFLVGQAWTLYVFREVLAGVDTSYVRLALIMVLDVAVAAVAFLLGARAGRNAPSRRIWFPAFVAGFIVNTITVGTYPVLPHVAEWQLELATLAIAVLAIAFGWLLPKLIRTPHGR